MKRRSSITKVCFVSSRLEDMKADCVRVNEVQARAQKACYLSHFSRVYKAIKYKKIFREMRVNRGIFRQKRREARARPLYREMTWILHALCHVKSAKWTRASEEQWAQYVNLMNAVKRRVDIGITSSWYTTPSAALSHAACNPFMKS